LVERLARDWWAHFEFFPVEVMKLLVITHTFPPSKYPNAKRPHYLVRAFLEAGWEVDVITSFIGVETNHPEVFKHANLKIIRFGDVVSRVQRKFRALSLGRIEKVVAFAANGILFPDYCALWVRKVFRKIRKEEKNYDRVLAFVFPPAILLAGSYGVINRKWIFDFQESVTPQFERFPRKSFIQRAMLNRLKRLERKSLHEAGVVVFTADSNRLVYIEKGIVPAERTRHLPYFYDEAAFGLPDHVGKNFEICYCGSFDLSGARSPEVFLKSLADFLDRFPEARKETKFVFHGSWWSRHDSFVDELGLRDVCEINSAVPYDAYLKKLQTSAALLLVVAREHDLFMPSKIVDYFGARRPILAFVPDGSEMSGVLKNAGMERYSCLSDSVSQGADAISRLWEAYQERSLTVDEGKISAWSSAVLVPKYLQILEEDLDV